LVEEDGVHQEERDGDDRADGNAWQGDTQSVSHDSDLRPGLCDPDVADAMTSVSWLRIGAPLDLPARGPWSTAEVRSPVTVAQPRRTFTGFLRAIALGLPHSPTARAVGVNRLAGTD
jgi:hypothetical protein